MKKLLDLFLLGKVKPQKIIESDYEAVSNILKRDFSDLKDKKEDKILFLMYGIIQKYIKDEKIDDIILYLEKLLEGIPHNSMHEYIWKSFDESISTFNENIEELINKYERVDYIYIEINWFTINYGWDLYISLLKWEGNIKFDATNNEEDLFDNCEVIDDSNSIDLIFWDNQKENDNLTPMFSEYFDDYANLKDNLIIKDSIWICELLIILRLNEFVRKSILTKTIDRRIPIYLNAHDYDFTNKIIY